MFSCAECYVCLLPTIFVCFFYICDFAVANLILGLVGELLARECRHTHRVACIGDIWNDLDQRCYYQSGGCASRQSSTDPSMIETNSQDLTHGIGRAKGCARASPHAGRRASE